MPGHSAVRQIAVGGKDLPIRASSSRLHFTSGEPVMLANYGYSDGSGSYFITIDTERCTGCEDCVTACPSGVFEVVDEDPNDPMNDEPQAVVRQDKKNKVKYECGPCKQSSNRPPLPCVEACKAGAISHSW